MNYYCTLFNSAYLFRGLTMLRSLHASSNPKHVYVLCMDDLTYHTLALISLKNTTLIRLNEFESTDLLKAKQNRSFGEYCWTCTASLLWFLLNKYQLPNITYVDADLYFFNNTDVLAKELLEKKASILITLHRYTPKYDKSALAGKYCVQYMTFVNDSNGRICLEWWKDRCLEWCYARFEDGKFGDQKYLDDWTSRFKGVHVLESHAGGVAPWNVQQYKIEQGPLVNSEPVVFYHFHNLKYLGEGKVDLCRDFYDLSADVRAFIYRPYVQALNATVKEIRAIDSQHDFDKIRLPFLKNTLHSALRKLKGKYYVVEG